MSRLLTSAGRLLVDALTGKLLLDTAGCIARCCGGCELFYKCEPCRYDPSDRCNTDETPIWICSNSTCRATGLPVRNGEIILIAGRCYSVFWPLWCLPPEPNQTPSSRCSGRIIPPGSLISFESVFDCATGCDDPRCNLPGRRFLKTEPCDSNYPGPQIWVCKSSVSRCYVGRVEVPNIGTVCVRVKPTDVPEADEPDLPPGVIKLPSIGYSFRNCCECACEVFPLFYTELRTCPNSPPEDPLPGCCCLFDRSIGRVTGYSYKAEYRRTNISDGSSFWNSLYCNWISTGQSGPDSAVPWRYGYHARASNDAPFDEVRDGFTYWDCGQLGYPAGGAPSLVPTTCGVNIVPFGTETTTRKVEIDCTRFHMKSAYHLLTNDGVAIETNDITMEWLFEVTPNTAAKCSLECSGGPGLLIGPRPSRPVTIDRQTTDQGFGSYL